MDKPIFPEVKKEVSNFLYDEEGNIPRNKLLSIGTTIVLMTMILSAEAYAAHSSHKSHSSHVSHSSGTGGHSSHSSGSITPVPPHSSSGEIIPVPPHSSGAEVLSIFNWWSEFLAFIQRIFSFWF
jgi:hypothetical protein